MTSYVSVVSLQMFNGGWKFDDNLISLMSEVDKQLLTDAAPVKVKICVVFAQNT